MPTLSKIGRQRSCEKVITTKKNEKKKIKNEKKRKMKTKGTKAEEEAQWTILKIKQMLQQTVSENDNSMRLYKLHTITAHLRVGPKRCVAGSTVQDCTSSSGKLSFQSPPHSNGMVRIDIKSPN